MFYQAQSGAVYLVYEGNMTMLTLQQIEELHIDTGKIDSFNAEQFHLFYQSHSIYFLSIYRYFLSCVSSKRQIYATVQSYSVYLIKRNLNLTA